ncbi:MAG: protein kinase [Planctomycetes bacterium]|nr:protein kinase [Planctomycetota bacterium]
MDMFQVFCPSCKNIVCAQEPYIDVLCQQCGKIIAFQDEDSMAFVCTCGKKYSIASKNANREVICSNCLQRMFIPKLNVTTESIPSYSNDYLTTESISSIDNECLMSESIPSINNKYSFRVDNYELFEKLGQGGMGSVYKAKNVKNNKIVAVKLLNPQENTDEAKIITQRFLLEGKICLNLKHPNIIHVYSMGEYHNAPYIAMEYIDGVSLLEYVQKPHVKDNWKLYASLFYQLTDALHYIHSRKIIHRDIKPSNILVTGQGKPILMDFGIAKKQDNKVELTQAGNILGTIQYMSYEQANDESVSPQSDIYSLGAVLYHVLTNQPPYTGNTTAAIFFSMIKDTIQKPSSFNDKIPCALEQITLKTLEKDLEKRYKTARALQKDLKNFFVDNLKELSVAYTLEGVIAAEVEELWNTPEEPPLPEESPLPSDIEKTHISKPSLPRKAVSRTTVSRKAASRKISYRKVSIPPAVPKKQKANSLNIINKVWKKRVVPQKAKTHDKKDVANQNVVQQKAKTHDKKDVANQNVVQQKCNQIISGSPQSMSTTQQNYKQQTPVNKKSSYKNVFLWVFFFIIVLIGSLFFFFPIEKNLGHFYNNFDNKESSVEKNNKESLVEKNTTLPKDVDIEFRSFWRKKQQKFNKKIQEKISEIDLWKYKYEWHMQHPNLEKKFQNICKKNEDCRTNIETCRIQANIYIKDSSHKDALELWDQTKKFEKTLKDIDDELTDIRKNLVGKYFFKKFKEIENKKNLNKDFSLEWWCFILRHNFLRKRYENYVKILQEKDNKDNDNKDNDNKDNDVQEIDNDTKKIENSKKIDNDSKEKEDNPKKIEDDPKKKDADFILKKLIDKVKKEKNENREAIFYEITILLLEEWQKPEEVSNKRQSNEKDKGIPENIFKNLITFCNNQEYISMMQECQKISYLNKERQKTIIFEKNPALFFWVCPDIFTYLKFPNCTVCDGVGIQICPDCKGTQIKNFTSYKCKCKEHASGKYVTCIRCKGSKQINLKKEVKFKKKELLNINIDCYCCNKTGQITESQKNCKKCSGIGYIKQKGCPKCNSTGVIVCNKCKNTGLDFKDSTMLKQLINYLTSP